MSRAGVKHYTRVAGAKEERKKGRPRRAVLRIGGGYAVRLGCLARADWLAHGVARGFIEVGDVVLLAPMALNLRHDPSFDPAAYFPLTIGIGHIGAAEGHFIADIGHGCLLFG